MMSKMKNVLIAVALISSAVGTVRAADQKTFATPAEAVQALMKATEDGNQDEMLAIFGDDGKALVYSGDDVQDKTARENFVKSYRTKHLIVAQDANTRILEVGANDWPMPIPIVNDGGKWRFDTAAGQEELVYRRIGHNEIGAIDVCRGFVEAEKDYAAVGHDGLAAGLYTRKLSSDAGKQNGLYWETADGEPTSPGGPLLAEADSKGYSATGLGGKNQPYHGYVYRILTAQGASARGGAKSYLVDGNLSGGVGLVAYPAQYRVSGVMTFIINQNGVVYQKDLGEKTAEAAEALTEYNPDSTWKKVSATE
jgi:Protein of unknown function (DUF2950)